MRVYHTIEADKNVITGYGEFIFTTQSDAKLAIKLAEEHAANVLRSYQMQAEKIINEMTNQFE